MAIIKVFTQTLVLLIVPFYLPAQTKALEEFRQGLKAGQSITIDGQGFVIRDVNSGQVQIQGESPKSIEEVYFPLVSPTGKVRQSGLEQAFDYEKNDWQSLQAQLDAHQRELNQKKVQEVQTEKEAAQKEIDQEFRQLSSVLQSRSPVSFRWKGKLVHGKIQGRQGQTFKVVWPQDGQLQEKIVPIKELQLSPVFSGNQIKYGDEITQLEKGHDKVYEQFETVRDAQHQLELARHQEKITQNTLAFQKARKERREHWKSGDYVGLLLNSQVMGAKIVGPINSSADLVKVEWVQDGQTKTQMISRRSLQFPPMVQTDQGPKILYGGKQIPLPKNFPIKLQQELVTLREDIKELKEHPPEIYVKGEEDKKFKKGSKEYKPIIGTSDCQKISFNNKKNFGPNISQRESPYCWAHSSAALLEEQLCLKNSSQCGENISRTQIVAQMDPDKLINPKGGNTALALNRVFGGNNKLCLEKYAGNPFNTDNKKFIDDMHEFYQNQKSSVCSIGNFHKNFEDFEKISWRLNLMIEEQSKNWKSSQLQKYSPIVLDEILKQTHGFDEFFKEALLHFCSDETRDVPQGKKAVETKFTQSWKIPPSRSILKNYIPLLKKIRVKKVSFNINFCNKNFIDNTRVGYWRPADISLGPQAPNCGPHAAIVNGIRWNPTKQRCESRIKNSHSEDDLLQDNWFPLEILLSNAINITYID